MKTSCLTAMVSISQIFSSGTPLENKAIIKESSMRTISLEKLSYATLSEQKTSENKMHIQNKLNFMMDLHPKGKGELKQ